MNFWVKVQKNFLYDVLIFHFPQCRPLIKCVELTNQILDDIGSFVRLRLQLLNILLHLPDLVKGDLDVLALEGFGGQSSVH